MSGRNGAGGEFEALRIEGGLFAPEWLSRVAALKAKRQSPADYGVPKGLNLRDEISRYWRIAQALWAEFQSGRASGDPLEVTRPFVKELLRQVFDLEATAVDVLHEIAGRGFCLALEARGGRVPVAIGPCSETLDATHARHGDGARRRSAFGLLQEYLNASDDAHWGLASNGITLRLARDNTSLTRPAWLEADLERIFTEDRFADFSVLWLFVHGSRFGATGAPAHESALEEWRAEGQEEGIRARDALRIGVEQALQELGQGFVSHPANASLNARLDSGDLAIADWFNQILRLVYRLIFLLTVEERGLLHRSGADASATQLYAEGYSLRRLRERSLRRSRYDRHPDLWASLKPVFAGLARGEPRLALPALGGLFDGDQCPDLDNCEMENRHLLAAVFRLGWMRRDNTLVRVNWKDMGPEELGSVYESLLELTPVITESGRRFGFAERNEVRGHARKLSGSYYTPDPLVQQLLDTALEPVVQQRIAAHPEPESAACAILELSVIDPACGSGHFLLAAARRLADHLARIRSGGTPSAEEYRHALRDVVTHCIYGIDRNPVTLELARVALWLEAFTPDQALGFLDHHLICGDALLGLLDLDVVRQGIPDDAFDALTGDDRGVCRTLKRRNRDSRRTLDRTVREPTLDFQTGELGKAYAELDAARDTTVAEVEAKERRFEALNNLATRGPLALAADIFMAAFFMPKTAATENLVPTTAELVHLLHGNGTIDGAIAAATRQVARAAKVLHWPLAFPQVFARGGFDVVIGNPPWEVSQLEEEEYFAARVPEIAALSGVTRKRAIANLQSERPHVWDEYVNERHLYDSVNASIRGNTRFELSAIGKLNTYPLFAETALRAIHRTGHAGIIVPTGLLTDKSNERIFQRLVEANKLVSVTAFDNAKRIFPAVHPDTPFCLLVLGPASGPADFSFYSLSLEEANDPRRHFLLSAEDFRLLNPNTMTCPIFRSERDADLTRKIYRKVPVLFEETKSQEAGNPWGISFMQGIFNMTSDSGLFTTERTAHSLSLYEAKMIHQFDHRWATYRPANGGEPESVDVTDEQKSNPAFTVTPRYWVESREVYLRTARLPEGLLKSLRDRNAEAIVLCLAHWLFGQWLLRKGVRDPAAALEELIVLWREFVYGYRFARELAPTQLGLCGDNPACLKPLGKDYLPAAPAGEIEDNPDECTAWYRADPEAVAAFLKASQDFRMSEELPARMGSTDEAISFAEKLLQATTPKWFMGWRDITNATNERTVIASLVPQAGVGNKIPLMFFGQDISASRLACLLASLSSLALDYAARQKIGGTTLNYFIYKQLPIIGPATYTNADIDFITPRVLELTYTAHDLRDWAHDLGHSGPPFPWNLERRAWLRAELDAWYARLYGLTRDELRYILDPADVMGEDYPTETFRVLKNNEMKQYGEYRTRRLVLEAWDRLFESGAPRN